METASLASTAGKRAPRNRFLTLLLLISALVFGMPHDAPAVDVTLGWSPSPDPSVTGYFVYYGFSSANFSYMVDAGNRTDITLTGLQEGTTYYVVATAYTGNGDESTFSNVTTFTTPGNANRAPGGSGGGGGGCFIATAAWGSDFAAEVIALREFRDQCLLTNRPGRAFIEWYYRVSPAVAAVVAEHELLRHAARWGLTPVVYAVKYPAGAVTVLVVIPFVAIVVKRRSSRR